jgi:hypothetical protein
MMMHGLANVKCRISTCIFSWNTKNLPDLNNQPEFEISAHRMRLEAPLYENASYVKLNQLLPSITEACYWHYITLQGVKRGLVAQRHNYFVLMGRVEAPLLPSSLKQSGTHNYQTTNATNTSYSTLVKFSRSTSLHRCWHLRQSLTLTCTS